MLLRCIIANALLTSHEYATASRKRNINLSDDRPNKKTMMETTYNQMTCEQRREQCLELLRDRKKSAYVL